MLVFLSDYLKLSYSFYLYQFCTTPSLYASPFREKRIFRNAEFHRPLGFAL